MKNPIMKFVLILLAVVTLIGTGAAYAQDYDIVLKDGRVMDLETSLDCVESGRSQLRLHRSASSRDIPMKGGDQILRRGKDFIHNRRDIGIMLHDRYAQFA